MDQEKRRRTRVPVHFEVAVLLRGERIRVETLNISLTGILCRTDSRFQPQDPCRVTITLSNEALIEIDSTLGRVDPEETAIAFHAMDETSFFHLKRLLQFNAPDADRIDDELTGPAFDPPQEKG